MAGYDDLIELGFEGVDKVADKYYDHIYDHMPRAPHGHHLRFGKRHRDAKDAAAEDSSKRKGEKQKDPLDGGSDDEGDYDAPKHEYQRGKDKKRGNAYAGDLSGRGGDYDDMRMAVIGTNPAYEGSYAIAPRAPPPAPEYGYPQYVHTHPQPPYPNVPPNVNADRYDRYSSTPRSDARNRPGHRRRASSYSPPRRERERDRDRDRNRRASRDDRTTATMIGALAGGLLASAAKDKSALSTVGGAVVGGLMARQGDKWNERRYERRYERREERGSSR
ncbi:hypothetical protein M011DRAFT_466886 [Sporormia fimetaria CBS 119925]|uniref:Uncharacterized protein n=1 Tax=Sporormia fimetaria CBS 119925 TaxID=1340428 RepID=A0A6A6VCY1_9PLEO|nr:hypothetical protein M011DRAFT_466886 [Sporormia fimetaria CBS 119925]